MFIGDMIYQCYKHKGDFMNEACRPDEPKSRIDELNGKMKELGNEVVQTLRTVMKKREQYYGIVSESTDVKATVKGAVNELDWMIEDIRKMVVDIREYVETL